jgi:hypothetical protein
MDKRVIFFSCYVTKKQKQNVKETKTHLDQKSSCTD